MIPQSLFPACNRFTTFVLGCFGCFFSPVAASAQEDAAPPATKVPAAEAKDPDLEDYFVANAAYNIKVYPTAISSFEKFLKNHPNHAKSHEARRGLALSYYGDKQYDKAMPQFAALLAVKDLPAAISRDRMIMLHGQCLLLTGKKEDAKKLFVSELANIKAEAYRTAALSVVSDVSFGQSDWKEVLAWTGKLLGAKPNAAQSARGLYQQGYAHYQLKQPDAAVASLAKISTLKADPLWITRASYLLGECHNSLKQFDKAEAAYVAALPGLKGADAANCQYRLGLTRFVLKKYEESAADLGAYLKQVKDNAGPQVVSARLYLARSLLERGDFEQAEAGLATLSKGEGADAASANLWWARVYTRQQKKDFDRAAEILGKATEKFKDSAVIDDLRFDHANALMASSEPDWKAALAILQGLEQGGKYPQMAEVIGQLAVCQHKLRDFASSLAANEKFLASHSDHAMAGDARFLRAENLFLLNRLDEAGKAYQEFLTAHAEHGSRLVATYRTAQIHHDQGRWVECLKVASPLLEKKPEGRLYSQLPFIVGDCLFRQQNWEGAIAPLEAFVTPRITTDAKKKVTVTPDPNVDTALMQLAMASDRTKNRAKAKSHLKILISSYGKPTPQLPLALAEQGRLAFEDDDLKLARQALETFLAEDAKAAEPFAKNAPAQRARVHYYLGWVDAKEEKHEAAAGHFGEVVKLGDNPVLAPDAALQQGIAMVNSKNFEAAAAHFPAMLQKYPKHEKLERVVYYSGLSLARQKKWPEAAVHFKRVAQTFPKSQFADQALYEWAWCERAAKRMPEATKLYEELLAKHPDSVLVVKVQSELAELNLDSGDQDKVIARLTEALTKVKDAKLRQDMRYQLASAHFKKGDHEKAAGQFEGLLTDYPKSELRGSMFFQAGESRLKLGETVSARDHFAAAFALPDSPANLAESITMRLGETQALTGQHEDARKTYTAFLEKFKDSRWTRNAQFGLAYAMESTGNSEGAIPEYKKLLSDKKMVDLWTVRSRFQTGECYFNLQKYDDAVAEFVAVQINFKKYPSWQAKALLEIGRVSLTQDKTDQAKERFKDVIQRFGKEKAAVVAQQYLDKLRADGK